MNDENGRISPQGEAKQALQGVAAVCFNGSGTMFLTGVRGATDEQIEAIVGPMGWSRNESEGAWYYTSEVR